MDFRYEVQSMYQRPGVGWALHISEYAEDYTQARLRAKELRDDMETISCLNWRVVITDNGDQVDFWTMDDNQGVNDHRAYRAFSGTGERVDQHGQCIPEGYMFIGTRDNLDCMLHQAAKAILRKRTD